MRNLPQLRIHVNPLTGCWEWIGRRTENGYGLVSVNSNQQPAHRAVWEVLVGPIPDGAQLDHICRLRSCVNPTHLEEVTPAENLERMRDVRKPPTQPRRRRTAPPAAPIVEDARDLLADLAAVLGGDPIPAADVPPLLAAHVPGWAPYRSMTGKSLRARLGQLYGVKVPSTGNRWPVRPAAVRAALEQRDRDDQGVPAGTSPSEGPASVVPSVSRENVK